MSILSQNPPKVLYFSSFLYFTQREIQLVTWFNQIRKPQIIGYFLEFFLYFLIDLSTLWNFTELHWTSLTFTESHWRSLKFTVNTWARGKSSSLPFAIDTLLKSSSSEGSENLDTSGIWSDSPCHSSNQRGCTSDSDALMNTRSMTDPWSSTLCDRKVGLGLTGSVNSKPSLAAVSSSKIAVVWWCRTDRSHSREWQLKSPVMSTHAGRVGACSAKRLIVVC